MKTKFLHNYRDFFTEFAPSHKATFNDDVVLHFSSVLDEDVVTAITDITAYTNACTYLCSLYACIAFMNYFPNCSVKLAFHNITPLKSWRADFCSKKFILLVNTKRALEDDKVLDVSTLIRQCNNSNFEETCELFDDQTKFKYMQTYLNKGDSFIELPAFNTADPDLSFKNFLFNNPQASSLYYV